MTPTVTKIMSSRCSMSADSASAAASEIAPRIPLQPTTSRSRQFSPASARDAAGTQRASAGAIPTQASRTPMTTALTSAT